MLLSPGKNGLTSLFKEVRVFKEKSTNPNFWVRIFTGGVGVFHMKGWGQKSSVHPSKPGRSNFFGGISEILLGYPGSVRKVWEKKVCVQFLSQRNYIRPPPPPSPPTPPPPVWPEGVFEGEGGGGHFEPPPAAGILSPPPPLLYPPHP